MAETRTPLPTLCIGILTLNEAHRIAQCIQSASFADQVLVIDSGSSDRTREIAEELGAQVHAYTAWQGFAEQRNRLLSHVKTDYVFFLDADEVMTPAFAQELRKRAAGRDNPLIVIYADAGATHQAVVNVLDAARLAGLARVTFAAQSASGSGGSR